MTPDLFAIVLFAAALHACWNAIVKGGGDTLLTTIGVASSAALIAAMALPFLPQPDPASWPYVIASVMVQAVYYLLVARAYHIADMSQAYPLMRGTAPLLVALASAAWIGEALSPHAWLGVAILCAGILAMAREGVAAGGRRRGTHIALANAVLIASFTLIDGVGVRKSHAPAAYTLWLALLTALPLLAYVMVKRRPAFVAHMCRRGLFALLGGAGTLGSYGLALWAMTQAPVAIIAALRETSILFAAVISAFVLKESIRPQRIAAVCVIAVGAMVLRLA